MKKDKPSKKPVSIPVSPKKPSPQRPLVSSPEQAAEEIEGLRRDREAIEAAPTTADTSVRTSLI